MNLNDYSLVQNLTEAYLNVYDQSEGYVDNGYQNNYDPYASTRGYVTSPTGRRIQQRVRALELSGNQELADRIHNAASDRESQSRGLARAKRNKKRGPGPRKARTDAMRDMANSGFAESYDIYDIILSHLLDEGYCNTVEAAEVLMVNMSEEWREDILDEGIGSAIKGAIGSLFRKSPKQSRGAELRAKYGSGAPRPQRYNRAEKVYGKNSPEVKRVGEAGASIQHFTPRKTTHSGGYAGGGNAAARRSGGQNLPVGRTAQELALQHGNPSDPVNSFVHANIQDIPRDAHINSRGVKKPLAGRTNAEGFDLWGNNLLDESVDIYDIILSHLLDEGYCNTVEAAEVLMVNMSEEWRESIVEAETGRGPRLTDYYDEPPYSDSKDTKFQKKVKIKVPKK